MGMNERSCHEFAIASPWAADRAFARSVAGVHETLANALVILALLHGAVAKHEVME